jgi:hypothetical protein
MIHKFIEMLTLYPEFGERVRGLSVSSVCDRECLELFAAKCRRITHLAFDITAAPLDKHLTSFNIANIQALRVHQIHDFSGFSNLTTLEIMGRCVVNHFCIQTHFE